MADWKLMGFVLIWSWFLVGELSDLMNDVRMHGDWDVRVQANMGHERTAGGKIRLYLSMLFDYLSLCSFLVHSCRNDWCMPCLISFLIHPCLWSCKAVTEMRCVWKVFMHWGMTRMILSIVPPNKIDLIPFNAMLLDQQIFWDNNNESRVHKFFFCLATFTVSPQYSLLPWEKIWAMLGILVDQLPMQVEWPGQDLDFVFLIVRLPESQRPKTVIFR